MRLPQDIADFSGQWQLTRRIEDARAGQILHATGTATLVQQGARWLYDEVLSLRVPGQADMTATRRYIWHDGPQGIRICFEDGRFFHHLTLGETTSEDHHDCAPDSYDARYDFSSWPRWSVDWTVSGPRKAYVMHTDYDRVP